MKIKIVAALLGLSEGIKLTENTKLQGQTVDQMHEICKSVHGIEYPHQSVLVQMEEESLPIADKRSTDGATAAPATTTNTTNTTNTTSSVVSEQKDKEQVKKIIQDSYEKHYGKSKEEVDKENKEILDTQAKCLNFVKTHQGHPEVCEWCQKEYKRPQVVWKWNPEEKTWYRWYDGGWHYWGPSKDGFTEGGWSWYNGYWHNDGYVFKYENNTWTRFQDREWVPYNLAVPVDPTPPTGGKICRPFYKQMQQGFPSSLASTQVPRCKVGDQIYMWTDDAACKFLGGVKAYQERVNCKSGEEHKWKRVVKCVIGQTKLANGGFDYNTGNLGSELYAFKQCGLYRNTVSAARFLHINGKLLLIPDDGKTFNNLFVSGAKMTPLTSKQQNSATRGKQIKPGSTVVSAQGGSFFLDTYTIMQFESEDVFSACQFSKNKVKEMTDAVFVTKEIGDIITV